MIIFYRNRYGINLTVIGITCFSFIGLFQRVGIGLPNVRLVISQRIKDYFTIQVIFLRLICLFRLVCLIFLVYLFRSSQCESKFIIFPKAGPIQFLLRFQLKHTFCGISIGNDKPIATLCVCSIRSSGCFQSSITIVRYRYFYNHIIFGISITRMFGRFIYLPYCIIIIPYLILVKEDSIEGESTVCSILLI